MRIAPLLSQVRSRVTQSVGEMPKNLAETRKPGDDPVRAHISLGHWLVYRDLHPEIDLVFSGEKGDLTRTLVVRPEGDIGNVRMEYAGVESVELAEDGAIRLKTAVGTIRERPPTAQRVTGDKTVPMRVEPQLVGESELGFIPTSQ